MKGCSLTHINFVILNSYKFKIYKNSYFKAVKKKIENSCIDVFQAIKLKSVIVNKITPVRKSYIWKSVKNRKTNNCRKVWKWSLVSVDSFIKSNLYMTFKGWNIFLCTNGEIFDFIKTPFRYYVFSVGINVFLWSYGERYLYHKADIAIQTL